MYARGRFRDARGRFRDRIATKCVERGGSDQSSAAFEELLKLSNTIIVRNICYVSLLYRDCTNINLSER